MSSRNQYLTDEERSKAPVIHQTLLAGSGAPARRRRAISPTIERTGVEASSVAGFRPDYFAVRSADDLSTPRADTRQLVVLMAARLGRARLIDNLQLRSVSGTSCGSASPNSAPVRVPPQRPLDMLAHQCRRIPAPPLQRRDHRLARSAHSPAPPRYSATTAR